MGPTISGIEDVYITQNTTVAVEDMWPGANMFRYSNALSLWDYVTTGSMDANSPDKVFWAYAIKDADYATKQATGGYLTTGAHYQVGTISPIAPVSAEGTSAWTAEINAAATQSLQDADPLTFRNIRLSPLPDTNAPYPAPTKDPVSLPGDVYDFQQATVFVTDKATTPGKTTMFLVTVNTGVDRLSAGGPAWANERTFSNFDETAGGQPLWSPFEYDVFQASGTNYDPGNLISETKTASQLRLTSAVSQTAGYGPYAQWAPPSVNEYAVGATQVDKLLRMTMNASGPNAGVAANCNIRFDINGNTQGPGEGIYEFAAGSGTGSEANGPTTTARDFSAFLWPAAQGTIAPTFKIFDDSATRGGAFNVNANVDIDSIAKADLTGGTVLYDRGNGGTQGVFEFGTAAGQWSTGTASFAGILPLTSAPTFTSSGNGTALTVGFVGTVGATQGGLVKYGSGAGIYTTQADKLYVIKVRVAGSSDTTAVPALRIITARGNADAQFLLTRNLTQGNGLTTTARDYYCVFQSEAATAGAWDLGIEASGSTSGGGTLTISRVTVTEYPLPLE
jgi:hypothetical protein